MAKYVVKMAGGNNFYTDDYDEAIDVYLAVLGSFKEIVLLELSKAGEYKTLWRMAV